MPGRPRLRRSYETFVANSRRRMASKGLAISDLARRSHLDRMVFYRIFGKEAAVPSLEAAIEIADGLGTTVDDLCKERDGAS